MKERRCFPFSMLALAAMFLFAVPTDARAFLWFGGNPFKEADAAFDRGVAAADAGRSDEALDEFTRAQRLYAEIHAKKPDARPEHARQRNKECQIRLKAIFVERDQENSDKLHFSSSEEELDGAPPMRDIPAAVDASAPTHEPAAREAAPAAVADETPAVAEAAPAVEEETSAVADEAPAVAETAPAPADTPLPVETAAAEPPVPVPSVSVAAPSGTTSVKVWKTAEDRARDLVSEGKYGDAVLLLEETVEDAGEKASASMKIWFARALAGSRNYERALAVLEPLAEERPDDPSVESLLAGVYWVLGNPVAAVRCLDTLVTKNPRCADAYIDFAYARFSMNPEACRDEAVRYYQLALRLGAGRDMTLEKLLDLKVIP